MVIGFMLAFGSLIASMWILFQVYVVHRKLFTFCVFVSHRAGNIPYKPWTVDSKQSVIFTVTWVFFSNLTFSRYCG